MIPPHKRFDNPPFLTGGYSKGLGVFRFFFKHAVWCLKQNQNASSLKTMSGQTCFKQNLNASRPSEHPPVKGGGGVSKRLVGGIIGCKDKTSLWHLIGFPAGSNIGSAV